MPIEARLSRPARGRVPTAHMLGAAIRAAGTLDATGTPIDTARDSYLRLPTGGLYCLEDLIAGEELLVQAGLVSHDGNALRPSQRLQLMLNLREEDASEVLLSMVLSAHPPLWVYAALREDQVFPELIPDADRDALTDTISDSGRREALLLALARRYERDVETELGELGEELVVAECRAQLVTAGRRDLAERVQRVSLISDQLGYDVVAPTLAGGTRRMEVKTTASSSEVIRVYLSRNEAEVGLRDPSWALVVCRPSSQDCLCIAGWRWGNALEPLLPVDKDPRATWASAAVSLQPGFLTLGLPPP